MVNTVTLFRARERLFQVLVPGLQEVFFSFHRYLQLLGIQWCLSFSLLHYSRSILYTASHLRIYFHLVFYLLCLIYHHTLLTLEGQRLDFFSKTTPVLAMFSIIETVLSKLGFLHLTFPTMPKQSQGVDKLSLLCFLIPSIHAESFKNSDKI